MRYLSTRGHPDRRRFCEILLEGLAPDGGLYLPERYPKVDAATLARWRGLRYHELAFEILSLFIDDIPASDPIKRVAMGYIDAYQKQFGDRPATFGANTYDSGLILQRAIPAALKAGKPGSEAFRSALRDAIEHEREIVGCQGVFNMSETNHNGMDERARVLVVVKQGKFRLLGD